METVNCLYRAEMSLHRTSLWDPYFKTDIKKIENVRRRCTKGIFPKLSYNERLLRLHLQTLEMRRLMADLTTCYKLLHGLIDIDFVDFCDQCWI